MMNKISAAVPLVLLALSAGEAPLFSGEAMDIPVGSYRTVRFEVPEHLSEDAAILGELGISPDTASVELILLHMDDYLRWRGDLGGVDTLAYRLAPSGSFEMDLPGLGSYALVVSGRGNREPATVTLRMRIRFSGDGSTGDPLPVALKLALIIIIAGIAAFAAGSVIVSHLHGRKRSV